jgi:GNAT superfamily N-acetyltransferase
MARQSVTVWHLELPDRAGFRPSGRPPAFDLVQLLALSPEFLRFLYHAVGGGYHWTDRSPWTLARWAERLADRNVEVWVAWQEGAPAGYVELERHSDGTVEIVYFGLLPHAVGQGHGGPLLTAAVRRAWELEAKRVYVNTCSLDHPAARTNYEARGFRVFREEVKERDITSP